MIDSILPALGRAPNASHCLCRTASAGSIDSTAFRILALWAARPSHRSPPHFDEPRRPANLALQVKLMSSTRPLPLGAVLIRWLQLIQTFGLPTVLPQGPVRNWSSFFEQEVERMISDFQFPKLSACCFISVPR